MAERVRIVRLGGGGDGVAETERGPLYVAGALPGETVLVAPERDRGRLLDVEVASPDRIAPFCPYYGRCGGCVAQHVGPALYAGWKRDKVVSALSQAGLPTAVEPLVDGHGEGRRRVVFHARVVDGAVRVGFMQARRHDLVEIDRCPITAPGLACAAGAAETLARDLANVEKPLDIAVTATLAGLDIDLRGSGPLGERRRQALIGRAEELDLARLSLHGETLIARRPPLVAVGRAHVLPPPGAFLQATAAGEAIIAEAVASGLAGTRRVLDLFAGIGPFALRLAEAAEVHAIDGDAGMLSALDRAARETAGLRRVTTETRDLYRRPLLPLELARYDGVVLDPPRAGAEAQARQLALAAPGTVVMVSCDPGTFARDARILVEGGLALERVLPVDQFTWSAHVEIVGLFWRPKAPRLTRRQRRAPQG